jgi:hypothetical protein
MMISDEKCPPLTPSCISYNIVGIFEFSKNTSELGFDLDGIIFPIP